MGDARLRMAEPWNWKKSTDPAKRSFDADQLWIDLGLNKLTAKDEGYQEKFDEYFRRVWANRGGPDLYYQSIVVDAFSSDAIPVHLITKEALEMYISKLAPAGVLCIHTSNRHVELVPVVVKVSNAIREPAPRAVAVPGPDSAQQGRRHLPICARQDQLLHG